MEVREFSGFVFETEEQYIELNEIKFDKKGLILNGELILTWERIRKIDSELNKNKDKGS